MKIKKWIWGIGIVVALALMVGLDGYKAHKEEQPPIPHVTVGTTEVNVTLGPFKWNGELMNDKEQTYIVADAKITNVNPLEDFKIDFDGEQPTYVRVLMLDPLSVDEFPFFEGNSTKDQIIYLPNEPGFQAYKIMANFKDGKKGTYYVALEKEQVVSYQSLLSEDSYSYSILYVSESEYTDPFANLPLGYGGVPISGMRTSDINSAQQQYPDLNITKSPSFYIFNDKEVIFQSNNSDEIIEYFVSKFEPFEIENYGPVMKIDRVNKIVNVGGHEFYTEEIESLKLGQEVHMKVKFNHMTDPKQTEVQTLTVELEPPEELQDEQWRSTSPDKYSVLGIGDGAFLDPLSNPKFTEQFPEVEVKFHTGDLYPLGYTFVVFNHEEAIYATYNYDELVKYLEEHPLK